MNEIKKEIEKKQELVKKVADLIEESESVIVIGFKSCDNKTIFNLKKTLMSVSASFHVYTNNVIRRALNEKGYKVSDEIISDMNGLIFMKNTMLTLKALFKFCEDSKIVIKIGVIENDVQNYDYMKKLSLIPTKEESIAKIIFFLKKPMSDICRIIKKIKEKNNVE